MILQRFWFLTIMATFIMNNIVAMQSYNNGCVIGDYCLDEPLVPSNEPKAEWTPQKIADAWQGINGDHILNTKFDGIILTEQDKKNILEKFITKVPEDATLLIEDYLKRKKLEQFLYIAVGVGLIIATTSFIYQYVNKKLCKKRNLTFSLSK